MEFVYVVPRERLFPEFYPQGLRAFGDGFSCADFLALAGEHGFFVERAYAEREPGLKQIIPYAIVCTEGGLLLTRRTRRGGESRLFDKLSIGIGGHVEPIDLEAARGSGDDARAKQFEAATRREIHEELRIDGAIEIEPVGILNDDSNAVGAVHVGLVQRVRVDGEVRIRERELLEGSVVGVSELQDLLREGANLETWSAMLVPALESVIALGPAELQSSRA